MLDVRRIPEGRLGRVAMTCYLRDSAPAARRLRNVDHSISTGVTIEVRL